MSQPPHRVHEPGTTSRRPSRPPKSSRPTTRTASLTELQRLVGNRALSAVLGPVRESLQRVPVNAQFHETLYNTENATGAHQAGGFQGGTPTSNANVGGDKNPASYDISRSDTGVTVLIKIRFLQQDRNTVAPPNPNPTNLPRLGSSAGVAEGDPRQRPVGPASLGSRDRHEGHRNLERPQDRLHQQRQPSAGRGRRRRRTSAATHTPQAAGHVQGRGGVRTERPRPPAGDRPPAGQHPRITRPPDRRRQLVSPGRRPDQALHVVPARRRGDLRPRVRPHDRHPRRVQPVQPSS